MLNFDPGQGNQPDPGGSRRLQQKTAGISGGSGGASIIHEQDGLFPAQPWTTGPVSQPDIRFPAGQRLGGLRRGMPDLFQQPAAGNSR